MDWQSSSIQVPEGKLTLATVSYASLERHRNFFGAYSAKPNPWFKLGLRFHTLSNVWGVILL